MKNYMRMCLLLLLAVCNTTIYSCKGKKMDAPEKVFGIASYYELILEDSNSNHEIKEVIVVKSQDKMQELYAQFNSTRRPGVGIPQVDFKTEVVIFAYGGQLSTGGYQLDITEVTNKEDLLHFDFKLVKPDGMATMSLTTPVKIIKVRHDDKKITASF